MRCERWAVGVLWLTASVAVPACGADDGATGGAQGSSSSGAEGGSSSAAQTTAEPTSGASTDPGSGSAADGSDGPGPTCNEDSLSELYDRYVEPFVSGAVEQSCATCHMTGVDLSLYAQDNPCDTMACMVELGVVDFENPEQSQILEMINMGDPQSSVFDVRTEHEAMLEWIGWSAECHSSVCGETQDACEAGTGSSSTGINPIGDCSEEDLLVVFWDSVIKDRGRCLICHSKWAVDEGTFGACTTADDCSGPQLCADGYCRAPGPWTAPHFFEGVEGNLDYNNPAHRQLGLATMYNIIARGQIDTVNPLESTLLTKPLLEDFQPMQIYGEGVTIQAVPSGEGVGIPHGGTSKFNFGCHDPPCLEQAVVDCRTDRACGDGCPDGQACLDGYCRMPNSVCDPTYAAYVRFVEYFAECN